MSVTHEDLVTNKRRIIVPTSVGDLDVVYKPASMTPAAQARIDAESTDPSRAYVRAMVDSWGLVLDERDEEYPRTEDRLRELPVSLVDGVAQAMFDDLDGEEFVIRDLRRWILSGGNIGQCPWWYPLFRAARYLGVDPWDLADKPSVWRTWALQSEAAELGARSEMIKRQERNRKR